MSTLFIHHHFDKFTYVDARIVQESPIRRVIYLQNMIPIDFEDIFKSIFRYVEAEVLFINRF